MLTVSRTNRSRPPSKVALTAELGVQQDQGLRAGRLEPQADAGHSTPGHDAQVGQPRKAGRAGGRDANGDHDHEHNRWGPWSRHSPR